MVAPSASDVQQYYKWLAIKLLAFIVAFTIYYKFLSKKYGIMSLLGLLLIIFVGIMYFQYKDGYIPWTRRSWM
jgi:predicted histidine transporter YuiF (NhaC family)